MSSFLYFLQWYLLENITVLLTDYAWILSHLSYFVNPSIHTTILYINALYYIFEYVKVSLFSVFILSDDKNISLQTYLQAGILYNYS